MPLRRLLLLPFLATLAFGAAPEARIDEKHRAFLKEYCVECHNADKQRHPMNGLSLNSRPHVRFSVFEKSAFRL